MNRLPDLSMVSPGIFRDEDELTTIQITFAADNENQPVVLNENDKNFSRRTVSFYMDACVDDGSKYPILRGSIKIIVANSEPTPGAKEIVPNKPVTKGNGDVEFSTDDVKDTITEILNLMMDNFQIPIPNPKP